MSTVFCILRMLVPVVVLNTLGTTRVDSSETTTPTSQLESLRCSDQANIRARHATGAGAEAEAFVLARAAHRLWPENPEVVGVYVSALVDEGRLDEAEEYLLDRTRNGSPEIVYPVMAGYVSYLVSESPPEAARKKLQELLEAVSKPAVRGAILTRILLLDHVLGHHDREMSTFRQVAQLQPLNPHLVARSGLTLIENHSPLPPRDGVHVLACLTRAILHPVTLSELAVVASAVDSPEGPMLLGFLESILSAEELEAREQQIKDHDRHFHGINIAEAREALESIDWSFLQTLGATAPLELQVVPEESEFGPTDALALEIRIKNRTDLPVPVGTPGPFADRVFVYGWTRTVAGPGASGMLHADLTNRTLACPNGVAPHGFVSQIARLGTETSGLIFDWLPTSDLETTVFAVSGIDEHLEEFDIIFMKHADEMLHRSTPVLPGTLPDIPLDFRSEQRILFSPIVVFKTRGFDMTDSTMKRLLARVVSKDDHAVLDLVRRLYESSGENMETTEGRDLKLRWEAPLREALMDQMQSEDFCRRSAAARALLALERYGDEEIDRVAVISLLRDTSWYVRLSVLHMIGVEDEGIQDDVAKALEDEKDPLVLGMLAAQRIEDE